MDRMKSVLISIGLFTVSFFFTAILSHSLNFLEYGGKATNAIGYIMFGTWFLLCGIYYKKKFLGLSGACILIFGIFSGLT